MSTNTEIKNTAVTTPEIMPKPNPLTEEEEREFKAHLEAVTNTAKANADLAHRLLDIKERKLYRNTYETWEAFCAGVLDLTTVTVNNQIKSYQIRMLLIERGISPSSIPLSDRPLRPLLAVKSPEETVSAFNEAVSNANGTAVTEDLISQAVQKLRELATDTKGGPEGARMKTKKNAKVLKLVEEVTSLLSDVEVVTLPLADVARIKLLKAAVSALETACEAAATINNKPMVEITEAA